MCPGAAAALAGGSAGAAERSPLPVRQLFRIGTGGERGTYFPIGSLLASALTGSDYKCHRAAGCGISGLLAASQLSNGSVANVEAISAGVLEAGLVQADVAHWAYAAEGVFADRPHARLRAVANLYPESVHIVARPGSGIRSIADLRGRRVSLDEQGSGTLVDARIILDAHGLRERDLKPVYIKPQFAVERLAHGELDAYFIVAGYPTRSVADLAAGAGAELVPIELPMARSIARRFPFLSPSLIPERTYAGVPETPTLSVGAQLLVSVDLSGDLVYAVTRELWSKRTLGLLAGGHPKGAEIRVERALQGLAIPLHPGAERYYQELGMR